MEFKRDFDLVQKRWAEFWAGTSCRPLIAFEIPKEGVEPVEKPKNMSGYDGNFAPVINQLLGWASTHNFVGEAIPFFYLTYGPDHFAALIGADLKFDFKTGTSWSVPFLKDYDQVEIKFNPNCFWFDRTIKFIRALKSQCDGRLLIAPPTMSNGLDTLAAIRGPQNLLMDMVMQPDKVKKVERDILQTYKTISDIIYDELEYKKYGSINRHGMYSSGKIDVVQCDISCMLSSEMYQEFGLPYTKFESNYLDCVEYHLDGPDAIRHLKDICSVENIQVIQWVPGAGEAAQQNWMDLYIEIDNLGKGQILWCSQDMVRKFINTLKSKQLFFRSKAQSLYEAQKFIEELEEISNK